MNEDIKLTKSACEVMSKNEKFLLENFRDIVDEIVELANDAIDYAHSYTKSDQGSKLRTESAIYFYATHVLMPSSYALLINLTTSNLPACFRDLRFMMEMLAKCYLADIEHKEFSFFERRLHALQHPSGKKGHIPEIGFIKEFAKKSNLGNEPEKFWRTLSDETHGRRYTERVVNNIIEHDNMPAYALIIPMVFRDGDKHDLRDLNNYIVSFRKILNKAMPKY